MTLYFAVVGNRDHIKIGGERIPFWEFLDVLPDGWLTSLAYERNDVPTDRPQMWDCGAWSYRNEEHPVFRGAAVTPRWALRRYEAVAVPGAFAVAPDHMLVEKTTHGPLSPFDLDARRRFNRRSAAAFLQPARDAGLRPVGVVHGQSAHERLEHAARLLDLGYDALAVGGVAARASERTAVLDLVAALREESAGAWLHVLGLSAPSYLAAWSEMGVDSCDGASHFKQAFAAGAYFTQEGPRLVRHQAARRGDDGALRERLPDVAECPCRACSALRAEGVETRAYGSNESNMGRAAHNLNMLMLAHSALREVPV